MCSYGICLHSKGISRKNNYNPTPKFIVYMYSNSRLTHTSKNVRFPSHHYRNDDDVHIHTVLPI